MATQSKNAPRVSVEELAAWSRKLVITVPAGRVRSQRDKVARALSKRVRRPGFRKGKAPLTYVEKRYGADIDRETSEQLIEEAFRQALSEEEFEPISQPRIGNVNYDRDSDLTFEVAFDIRPEIKPQRLGGFRLTRPSVHVSDEEVDEGLETLRQQHALWKAVERRPAEGDSVSVEITPLGDENGGEAEAPGKTSPYRFVLGQGQAIPEVEESIMKLEPGKVGEFSVSFPGDFQDAERRDTTQRLRIDLKQVMEPELPTVDDEFAKSVGDFDGLTALREAIAEDRLKQKKQEAEFHLEHQLLDEIIEANPFEVPESMVERGLASIQASAGDAGEELEAARREARPAVIREIKRSLILRRVAEDEGLAATEEEVGSRIHEMAERTGRQAGEVRALLAKSGDLRDLEWRITEEKVISYLKEQSRIEDGKVREDRP